MGVTINKGAWWIDYYVDGQRKRERIGGPLTKEMRKIAESVLAKRKVEIAENKFLDVKKQPVCFLKDLAEKYLGWAKAHHRGYTSTESRVKILLESFGNVHLKEITPLKIDEYIQDRSAIRAPATVNRESQILHHMFQKAIEWGMAIDNPVQHVKPLRVKNQRTRFLSVDEMERLLENADDILHPILLVALNTGMRRGEIFGLRREDVDFGTNVVRVIDSKNGESRSISMNLTLRDALKSIPPRLDSPYIFAGKTGDPRVDIKKRFTSALRRAQIDDFRFHDLRHTFASNLVMAGVDLATVKDLLGHKTIQMTLRYSHLSADHKASAVNRLDTYMDTNQKNQATASP